MKNQKGITLIILVLAIVVLMLGCILAFKIISSEPPKKTASKTSVATASPSYSSQIPSENSDISSNIRPNIKQAIDNYETFMDEFISFMTKYSNSKGNPSIELLKDYSEYWKKYYIALESFEDIKDTDLNDNESKYWFKVQLRVNQKLTDAYIDLEYDNIN